MNLKTDMISLTVPMMNVKIEIHVITTNTSYYTS